MTHVMGGGGGGLLKFYDDDKAVLLSRPFYFYLRGTTNYRLYFEDSVHVVEDGAFLELCGLIAVVAVEKHV